VTASLEPLVNFLVALAIAAPLLVGFFKLGNALVKPRRSELPDKDPPYLPSPTGVHSDGTGDTAVWLLEPGERKIDIIKAVRNATGLGLKESKDLVEGTPSAIRHAVPADVALGIHDALVAAGGTAELRRAPARATEPEPGPPVVAEPAPAAEVASPTATPATAPVDAALWEVVLRDPGVLELPLLAALEDGLGIDMAAAQALVKAAPGPVARLPRSEAEALCLALESAGAMVQVRPVA
jgi:large subunit ribosomal protein L7/L12